jgi:hypothetical protein
VRCRREPGTRRARGRNPPERAGIALQPWSTCPFLSR